MAPLSQFRCAVDGAEVLGRLKDAPLPLGLTAGLPTRSFHRDVYLDTPDNALGSRGVICRLRIQTDDQRVLGLIIGGSADHPPERWEATVPELDARRALEGTTEPARRLRGMVDPMLLKPRIEVETERWARVVNGGWLRRTPRFAFLYDLGTVRHGGLARTFEEIQVRRLAPGGPHLDQISAALERDHGIRPLVVSKSVRASQLIEAMTGEATARMLASQRAVALLAIDGGGVVFLKENEGLALPVARGSGEEACRHLLRYLFGSGVGDLTLLGNASGSEERAALEIWVGRRIRGCGDGPPPVPLVRLTLAEALAKVGTPELRHPETLAALALAARLDVGSVIGDRPLPATRPSALRVAEDSRDAGPRDRPERPAGRVKTDAPAEHFLNVELSQLAFHERVLEMGEDRHLPLAERLRYLAIVGSNLDEFFAVRVGALKTAIADGDGKRSFDGLSAIEQCEAIAARVPGLVERQGRAAAGAVAEVASRGFRIRRWAELDPPARVALSRHFQNELLPLLTPRAVTMAPGHPFPIIPHLTLAFAVLVRDIHTGPIHFAYLAIPSRLARFIPVPDSADLVLLEDVVRANLQAFYPERPVEQAWTFRITRGAEIDAHDEDAGDLLQAVEEDVRRRSLNAAVRLEVERGTPALVLDLLMKELRFERRGGAAPLGSADVYPQDAWLDLSFLKDLAGRLPPADQYAPLTTRDPFGAGPVLELIERGDQLVHHPFDDFDATVTRFIEEAALAVDVAGIKIALYRVGERSRLIDALVRAAEQGKDVAVFVELKARFDEARNATWVRRLEDVGAQVVYGIVGLKTHAKVALVIRETPDGVRRYAHIGTGNYHAGTARAYTDLGLFTADPDLTADVGDLFNQLMGSTQAPAATTRRLLVSPNGTVPGLLARIRREIEHQDAGRAGRIRIQVNGLEDPEIVAALYRASAAGVEIDLLIRGLCVLRPGVPGLSERIRVTSVLGRFLEHQRIYHFGNGGLDEYLIGSADLRPRNLRRRVEVLAPVERRDLKERLGLTLDKLLAEPTAWTLDSEGRYTRPAAPAAGRHVHDLMMESPPEH